MNFINLDYGKLYNYDYSINKIKNIFAWKTIYKENKNSQNHNISKIIIYIKKHTKYQHLLG